MTTLFQRLKYSTEKKKKQVWARRLRKRPQVKGWVMKVRVMTPRKPNSARRSIVKINLSTRKDLTSYIPGIGHNLRRFSTTLIRGGGARDLPGVNYSCIRGVYDFASLNKIRRRSIYGVKWDVKNNPRIPRRKRRLMQFRESKNFFLKNYNETIVKIKTKKIVL